MRQEAHKANWAKGTKEKNKAWNTTST